MSSGPPSVACRERLRYSQVVRLPRLALALVATLAIAGPACRLETEQVPAAPEATAPDFSLPAHDGRTVSLGDLVAHGPAVLVFYRGHW